MQDDVKNEPLLIKDDEGNEEEQNLIVTGEQRMCDVCYEESEQSTFFGLKCKHDYCQECIKDHLESNIKDGNVMNIPCLMAGCS